MAKKPSKRTTLNPFKGRWRITWMNQWDQDFVNEEVEGFFQFDAKNNAVGWDFESEDPFEESTFSYRLESGELVDSTVVTMEWDRIGAPSLEGEVLAEGETADVAALHGWRREVFGTQALRLVNGETAIKFERRKIRLFDLKP